MTTTIRTAIRLALAFLLGAGSVAPARAAELVPGASYTLTEEDIRRYGCRDLKDVLSLLPNIDVRWRYAGLEGGQRGFLGGFNRTLMLVNGRPFNWLEDGAAADTIYVPVFNIKEVTVQMGPGAASRGGPGTEGVIMITTKDAAPGEPDQVVLDMAGGSVNTQSYGGAYRKSVGNTSVGFAAHRSSTEADWGELADFAMDRDGFSRAGSRDAVRDRDPEHFRNQLYAWNYSGHVQRKGAYAGFQFTKSKNEQGLQAKIDHEGHLSETDQLLNYAGWRRTGEKLELSIEGRYVNNEVNFQQRQLDPETGSSYQAVQNNVRLHVSHRRRAHMPELAAGAAYRFSESHRLSAGAEGSRAGHVFAALASSLSPSLDQLHPGRRRVALHRRAAWAQDHLSIGRLQLTAGVRYQRESGISDAFLPNAAAALALGATEVKASFSRGLRGPSLLQRSERTFPDAPPQRMDATELSATRAGSLGAGRWSATAAVYHMTAKDLQYSFPTGTWKTTGLETAMTAMPGRSKVNGAEGRATWEAPRWSLQAGARYARPDERMTESMDLPGLSMNAAAAVRPTARTELALTAQHWAAHETLANAPGGAAGTRTESIPAFTTLNLNARLKGLTLGSAPVELSVFVENVLDAAYYHSNFVDSRNYRFLQPPRTVMARLTARL